jgi:hypothetical protein
MKPPFEKFVVLYDSEGSSLDHFEVITTSREPAIYRDPHMLMLDRRNFIEAAIQEKLERGAEER